MSPILRTLILLLSVFGFVAAQSVSTASSDGYSGYNLTLSQDQESATYETASTAANVSTTWPEPGTSSFPYLVFYEPS